MGPAIDNFQKNLFVLLLYASGFYGILTDIFMGGGGKTGFYIAFDGIAFFLALLSISWLKRPLGYIVLFLIVCFVINMSYSEAPVLNSLNGIREFAMPMCFVIFFNKIFAEGNEELADEYIQIMKKYVKIFLVVNIPVAAYQFANHGASDYVGGTYGNYGSGVLTLSVLCFVFFMSSFTRSNGERLLLFMTMIPLVLNETKVSFILIPLTVVLIYFQPKLKSIMIGAVAAVLFLMIINQYYSNATVTFDSGSSMSNIFSSDFINDYLFGDIYYSDDVPRFTKIIVAWQMIQEQINIFLFGFEYGLFRTGNMAEISSFTLTYQWLFVGTRPYLFFMLLQGGVMLTLGMFLLLAYGNRFFRHPNKFKTFLYIIFTVMLFYNDAFRNQAFVLLYFFLVFYANSVHYPGNQTSRRI